MKILKISGDDYSSIHFSDEHNGKLVSDIIKDISKFEPTDNSEGYWELEVIEFKGLTESIDPELLKWVKSEIDYDYSKHQFYYFDNETIKI